MHDEIPVGLATKLGAVGAGIAGLIAGVTAILHGDHTETTITGLLISGALIYGVVTGRMKQAAAAITVAGANAANDDGDDGDIELPAELAAAAPTKNPPPDEIDRPDGTVTA